MSLETYRLDRREFFIDIALIVFILSTRHQIAFEPWLTVLWLVVLAANTWIHHCLRKAICSES
jgi:hypothetical protein